MWLSCSRLTASFTLQCSLVVLFDIPVLWKAKIPKNRRRHYYVSLLKLCIYICFIFLLDFWDVRDLKYLNLKVSFLNYIIRECHQPPASLETKRPPFLRQGILSRGHNRYVEQSILSELFPPRNKQSCSRENSSEHRKLQQDHLNFYDSARLSCHPLFCLTPFSQRTFSFSTDECS